MTEELWYLKQSDLFRRVSPELLARLEPMCRSRKFRRGDPVYLPADSAEAAMVLAEGRIKIGSATSEGKQTILAFIEPGELFGELEALDGGPREEFAEAAEKSTVILLPAEGLRMLMAADPDLALGVTKLIGVRRRRIERRLKSLLFRSNRQRLVSLLLELAEQYGRPSSDPPGTRLAIKLSHQEMASVIGSTRETVTVVLGELQSEKLVSIGRRKIVVTNLNDLARAADGPLDSTENAPIQASP